MALLDLLFPLALAALALVLLVGLAHRIFAAMAWRNALRRPRQTAMIVAGLMVGTAIVSGALVSGDSMEYAIVAATLDAFGEIDETVYVDGFYFFPQAVAGALAADGPLSSATDAVGANILWDGAVTNRRTLQYEPSVRLVGFDPEADLPFGAFQAGGTSFTGQALGPDEVVLGPEAAGILEARVGDRLTLNFTRPNDPLLPTFRPFAGQLNASAGGVLPPPLPPYAEPAPWEQRFTVEQGSVRLSAVLAWNPAAAGPQDLDVELVSPSQRSYVNANGSLQAPDVPAVLNVPASLAQPLEAGPWTLRVHAKAGAAVAFNGTVVELTPVYDFEKFERRTQALRAQFPDFDPSQLPQPPRVSAEFRVAFIADEGKGPHFKLPKPYNVFVRLDALQALLARPGEVNMVKISNPGGVEEGPDSAPQVYPLAWERLNATKAQLGDHPAIQALRVSNDKVYWIEQAKELGQVFSLFLTFVGSFSVIAGLMLIINIFTMLAEERKAELGISRAVGLRRRHLTRLFVLEGAYYAFPAALLGTAAGLGLAAVLIWGFNAFDPSGSFPPIPFRLEAPSLLLAFATGILLTLGTVYVGARRASRLNVVRAIRNLEEPERIQGLASLWGGTLLTGLGVAGVAAAVALESFTWRIFGPTFLALGAGLLLRRSHARRRVYPGLALLLALYLLATVFSSERQNTLEANIVGPMRAVLITLCVVVALVYNEAVTRRLGRLLSRLPRFRAVATVAVSYPLHKKFRTGMTLAMFSVILLMVSLFTIFGALFTPDPEKEAGGYDIEAWTTAALPSLTAAGTDARVLDPIDRYDVVPYFLQIGGDLVKVENETTSQAGPPLDYVFGIDDAFAANNEFRLLRRDPAYATDAAVYLAVARSNDLVIVSYTYSTDEQGNDDRHQVGDPVQLEARGGVKTFTIVGIQEQFHFKGIFVSKPALRSLYADTDTLFLIRLEPGADEDAFSRDLEAAYHDVGLNAASIRSEVLAQSEQFHQIFTLIQLFLSLGLVVGILSLGIVTARNIIERRQEIGMMRALGFLRRHVRRAFLLETMVVVTLGVLVGAVVAIVISFGLWVSIVRDLNIPYFVPWWDLLVIAVLAYAATILSTLHPIFRASRIPPAEGLRYVE